MDNEAAGDESFNSSSRRRSRPEINRRVPHQSFAYGAPSDASNRHRRSISNSGGAAKKSGTGDPDASQAGRSSVSRSPSKAEPVLISDQEPSATSEMPQPSASARYAALKAKKQRQQQEIEKRSSMAGSFPTSPGPRRSTRVSIASESQDADNDSRSRAIKDIEEDQADESDDEEFDADGKVRKSSVPPPRSFQGPTTDVTSQPLLNSFFVRAPASSLSPGPSDDRSRSILPSSLLRGAQRPSHDPLSPRRDRTFDVYRELDSIRSSEAGESRSYASEEAFVRRQEDRDATPPAKALEPSNGWFQKLSPWRKNGPSNGEAGHDGEEEQDRLGRRKPRSSGDKTYKPPKDFDQDSSDEGSEDGRVRRRNHRRKSDQKDTSSRGGRDDNKIWMTKRRKGRRSGNQTGEIEGDEDTAPEEMSHHTFNDRGPSPTATAAKPTESRAHSSSSLRPFSDSILLKVVGLIVVAMAFAASIFPEQVSLRTASPSSHSPASNWIPFFLRRRQPGFSPPSLPPGDFDSFVARILALENTVRGLDQKSLSLRDSHQKLSRQVAAMELSSRDFAALLKQMKKDGAADKERHEIQVHSLTEAGKALREQVLRLESQIASRTQELQAGVDKLQSAEGLDGKEAVKQLKKVQNDLRKAEDELKRVAASARQAEDVARQAKGALDPLLEANLPAQMPVRLDKRTGKPSIEPWFYETLKSALSTEIARRAGDGSSSASADVIAGSWDSFRRTHEGALRALIVDEAGKFSDRQRHSQDGHALLSRADFVELLKVELDRMKGTLEQNFNDNVQGIQNEILAKVRAQQTMFEESGSWSKKAKAKQTESRGSALTSVPDIADLQSKDGSNPRDSILALIEAALEAYSSDRINKADYALYSAGGRVIPSMTSPTLDLVHGSSTSAGLLSQIPLIGSTLSSRTRKQQQQYSRGRSPVVALHHDNAPGMCWPFAGQSGQLGIQLARRTLVTDITVEHPPSTLTFGDSTSAPREVTISALVDRPEDRQKLASWRRQQTLQRQQQQHANEDDGEFEVISAPPSPNHLHLASFTYDASPAPDGRLRRSIQTFPVSPEARTLAIPVSVVQVSILSNHGEKTYTCLYRVRVHGEAWKEEA